MQRKPRQKVPTMNTPIWDIEDIFSPPAQLGSVKTSRAITPTPLALATASLPFYGGTSTETSTTTTDSGQSTDPPVQTSTGTTDSSQTASGGEPNNGEMTPEQIADLLRQVSDLTNKVSQLTTENNTYKNKENQAQRAAQSREQTLEQDLQAANETITKMDNALKTQAVINAINGFKEVEFHDPKFVLRELDPSIFDQMEVDLEGGTVTVTGIENDLRRIAREKDWAVKKNNRPADQQQQRTTQTRASGAPPAPPNGSNDKASRREALINKFPVIGHGRAPIR